MSRKDAKAQRSREEKGPSISATQAANGSDEVFGVLTDTSFWEYDPQFAGSHFQERLASGAVLGAAPQIR